MYSFCSKILIVLICLKINPKSEQQPTIIDYDA